MVGHACYRLCWKREVHYNVLLVEDEKKIVDFVCCGFREQGFTVDHSADGNVVDVCIQRIRKKIGATGNGDSPIESVRGVGYRFRKLD